MKKFILVLFLVVLVVLVGGFLLLNSTSYKAVKKISNPNAIFIPAVDDFAVIKYAIKSHFSKGDDSLCPILERPYVVAAPEQSIEFQRERCSEIAKSLSLLIDAKNTKDATKCLAEIEPKYNKSYLIEGDGDFCSHAVSGTDWPKLLRQFFLNITGYEKNGLCRPQACEVYTENVDRLVEFYNSESK